MLRWPSVSISHDWCWVRTEPSPPPHTDALGYLFKLDFWCLTLSTPKRCHMDLWLAWLVLIHHYYHRIHQLPSATEIRWVALSLIAVFFLRLKSGRFVQPDVLSHGCFVSGCYVAGCFVSGRFVSGRFVPPDVMSPDVPYCSRSWRRAAKADKRMVLVHTHGLFIT